MKLRWTSGSPPRDLVRAVAWCLGGLALLAIISLGGAYLLLEWQFAREAATRDAYLARHSLLKSLYDSAKNPDGRVSMRSPRQGDALLHRFPIGMSAEDVVAAFGAEGIPCRTPSTRPDSPYVDCWAPEELRKQHHLPYWRIRLTLNEAGRISNAEVGMVK